MRFQDSLLRLGIPKLEKTGERYLISQNAISNGADISETEKAVKDFITGSGLQLDKELRMIDKENKHTSYICGPWFDMYLSDRVPLPLNYNPFLGLLPEERPGYADPVIRVTNVIVSSMRFMRSLRENVLGPEVYHLNPKKSDTPFFRTLTGTIPKPFASYGAYAMKAFPLDMSQFKNLFNSTRIPETGKDRISADPTASHILIMKNGNFYVFDIFNNDGSIKSPDHIHALVSYIIAEKAPRPSHCIGQLTAENRDTWATVRKELEAAGNEETLRLIDHAAFCISLDDVDLGMDPHRSYRNFLYGDAGNRWFDKSFSLIFSKDGQASLNFEHAWGDGVAVMRYFNEVAKDSLKNSRVHPDSKPANIDASKLVKKLELRLTPSIEAAISRGKASYDEATSALAVDVLQSKVFDKSICKKNKVSPDAMMQLGFQLAYFMQNGENVATYESCSTSAFKHGRTETLRPATRHTAAFCRAATSKTASDAELRELLDKCSKLHGALTVDAAKGQGFDRHLFALRNLAMENGVSLPAIYTDPNYAKMNHNIISTSTLPSNWISFGGFGPVVRDGFGVGYQINDERFGLVVSSFPPHRDGNGFVQCAEEAYATLHRVLTK